MRDVERDDIEFISRTLGCLPIAHVDHMRPEKLGHAKLVEEESVSPSCCFLSLRHLIACLQIPHAWIGLDWYAGRRHARCVVRSQCCIMNMQHENIHKASACTHAAIQRSCLKI